MNVRINANCACVKYKNVKKKEDDCMYCCCKSVPTFFSQDVYPCGLCHKEFPKATCSRTNGFLKATGNILEKSARTYQIYQLLGFDCGTGAFGNSSVITVLTVSECFTPIWFELEDTSSFQANIAD
jgi:hypothetical protein